MGKPNSRKASQNINSVYPSVAYRICPLTRFLFYFSLIDHRSRLIFLLLFTSSLSLLFLLFLFSIFSYFSSFLSLFLYFLFLSFSVYYFTAVSLLYDCCLAFVVIHSLLLPFKFSKNSNVISTVIIHSHCHHTL